MTEKEVYSPDVQEDPTIEVIMNLVEQLKKKNAELFWAEAMAQLECKGCNTSYWKNRGIKNPACEKHSIFPRIYKIYKETHL